MLSRNDLQIKLFTFTFSYKCTTKISYMIINTNCTKCSVNIILNCIHFFTAPNSTVYNVALFIWLEPELMKLSSFTIYTKKATSNMCELQTVIFTASQILQVLFFVFLLHALFVTTGWETNTFSNSGYMSVEVVCPPVVRSCSSNQYVRIRPLP